ncbi:uncharacterized protein LOC133284245 [Gastrolobium bilobum]|uniref:uncharacterized protein LOC133284245 n=1 Tax=Gastrolobium bilobum TaxID=150636 RepID=UPI002AB012ED|nr:uncharacterized protein LOC133284245 [Gastrolobium bilobum]
MVPSASITVALLGLVFLAAFFLSTSTLPNQLVQLRRPLQWGVLCSVPLRGIQQTLVAFLSETHQLGLIQTLLAVPVVVITLLLGTLLRIREASLSFYLREPRPENQPGSRFSNLLGLLFTFWIFIIAYERLGGSGASLLLGLGFYFTSNHIVSTLSSFTSRRSSEISVSFTGGTLERLRIIVAVTLIVGFLTGLIFFSYKIGVEGKDAAIYLKIHTKESNYAVKKWLDENNVAEMVVSHTTKSYETFSDLAAHYNYNMTEFVTAYEHFEITRGDFVQTAQELAIKAFLSQWLSARNRDVVGSSAEFMIYFANFIISRAAQVYNYVSQVMLFISILYYLIIFESGGRLIAQVMGMLPISDHTRERCEEILNRAISVFLAMIKIAFSQGCLTWLLFRLFKIHFLYMSTVFAFISPLIPIFPSWLLTIQAAMQLALEGGYLVAVVLSVVHLFLMNFVASEITKDVPENFAHLTAGLSIIGGVTLFPSNLEGAIMGLLTTAVVIALKDLYVAFILGRNQGQRVTD